MKINLRKLKRAMGKPNGAARITKARKQDAKRMYMRLLWADMSIRASMRLATALLTPNEALRIEQRFSKRLLSVPQLPDEDE